MSVEETPCMLFVHACNNAGVKTPNPQLVKFFQENDIYENIKEIDISRNYVGNRGILSLLEMVKVLPNCRSLNLSDQKIYNTDLSDSSVKGNFTIERIVDVCAVHPTISSLNLSSNPISNFAGRKLLSLAKTNQRICRIDVSNTHIDFDLRNCISQQCQANTVTLWNEHAPQHDRMCHSPDNAKDGGPNASEDGGNSCGDHELGSTAEQSTHGGGYVFGASTSWTPPSVVPDLTSIGASWTRRTTVRAKGIDPEEAKKYVPPVFAKQPEETELICNLLMHNVLFSFLTSRGIRVVAGAMYRAEFAKGDKIITYGQENCDKLYIIQHGHANIIKEGQVVFVKTEGSAVGELELLYDTPAVATVQVCADKLTAWVLDRETYRNCVMGTCIRQREMYTEMLSSIPFLQTLDNYERMQVADALSSDEFRPGDFILRFGEVGEWLYIIVEGTVEVVGRDEHGAEKKVCTFSVGDHIGELEFLNNHRNVADVVALTRVTTAKLNRRHFEMCMGPVMDVLKRDSSTEKYEYYRNILEQGKFVAEDGEDAAVFAH